MAAMSESPAKGRARLREAVEAAAGPGGLDAAVAGVEAALATLWLAEREGALAPRDLPALAQYAAGLLKKIAPPPPRKVKFSDPPRKILPLSEPSVRPAFDAAMLLLALCQGGDFTETPDKVRSGLDLFLDDWRRMIWESARIRDWDRFRALVRPEEERDLGGRLSRESACRILRALEERRRDKITPVPDLSILACARCGRFEGRDRVRCARCKGSFCARCLGPATELCLPDYAARYASVEAERRRQVAADARAVLKSYRLDPHSPNAQIARALREEGVDVSFSEMAPLDGHEVEEKQERRRLLVRPRESPAVRRALYRALARCYFRAAGGEADPLLEDFFVDLCLGVPIEEALTSPP